MQPPENLTPFAVACVPSMDLDDRDLAVLVVAGTFSLPAPGSPAAPLVPVDDQPPVVLADTHHGEPGRSSLEWEGQAVPGRPGTDVYVRGHAWSPGGRPATTSTVGVRLGPVQRQAAVFGDRYWRRGLGAGQGSAPDPFSSIPLVYERCFGGFVEGTGASAAIAALNPIGRGLYPSGEGASDHPLPNIEDPRALLSGPGDRPRPHGFGPIARGWLPRRGFAGTYSPRWVQERAPLWPRDLDPRFFMAAAPGLQCSHHLEGGEPLVLHGMHPDGDLACSLPKARLVAKFLLADRDVRVAPVLDAVMIAADTLTLTLVWRASVPTTPTMLALDGVVVRPLEAWESPP